MGRCAPRTGPGLPVRLLGPGAALAVAYGLTSQDKAALWIALGGVVLVPGAAELARRKVTPTGSR